MKIIKIIIATLCTCAAMSSYALDNQNNYTLTLTVVNHTDKTLSYVGPKDTNPGNAFQVTPTEILPGGAATVTGTTSQYYDLSGQLRFRDDSGFVSLLKIDNNRHINYDQPKFAMQNENYISFTDAKVDNKNEDASVLMSSAATVVIENKL